MKKTLAGLAASAAIMMAGSMSALADGMPKGARAHAPAPMPAAGCCCGANRFAGWYGGVHGAFGSLTADINQNVIPLTYSVTDDDFMFGVQIGRNWTNCNFVFGIEADFSFANHDNRHDALFGFAGVTTSMDWVGSLRTRTGLAMDNLFLYVTGGIAFADISTRVDILGINLLDTGAIRWGWVGGVGTEYALSDRVRITGDLLYYDFGTESTSLGFGIPVRIDDHHSLWVSRIGINFSFGGHQGLAHHDPLK